jgi:hypothetical protein
MMDEFIQHVQDETGPVGICKWTGYRSEPLLQGRFADQLQDGRPLGVRPGQMGEGVGGGGGRR